MLIMKKTALLIALCSSLSIAFGQDSTNWMAFPGPQADTLKAGEVVIHKDSRIDGLVKYVGSAHSPETSVKLDGYRVQLYFNNDKAICNQARSRFLSITNDVRAYIQYQAPHYRLRVGNFRTLLQAEKFKKEISGQFPDAITVNDKIDLPKVD